MKPDDRPVEWKLSPGLVAYADAVQAMEQRVAAIRDGSAAQQVWLLEHPPLYTAGTSARESDLLDPNRLPVFRTGRGGQYTYHGPDQRIVYVMLDLKTRGQDLRAFVSALEDWTIGTLAHFNVTGEQRPDRVGVWVARDGDHDDKIAALGIRVRRWVSFHGISINLDPDLSHYRGIVPCGVTGHGVTSLVGLGLPVAMADLDVALRQQFEKTFQVETVDV
jgi:lipoyl(octanoyl) transferase